MKKISEEYAFALYELAQESSLEDAIMDEMKTISSVLCENPDYIKLLDNPALECSKRLNLAAEAFSGACEYVRNFIMLLVEAKRFNIFGECCKVFERLYDTNHNIIRAEAVTATALDSEQCEKIRAKLEKKTGKTVVLTNTVDKSVIGGVVLKYGGEQIDRSVRASLKTLSNMISQADV